MKCRASIENITGSVFFCVNCSIFYNTVMLFALLLSGFYFFVFTCTQNTHRQLKIKEISPHNESFSLV